MSLLGELIRGVAEELALLLRKRKLARAQADFNRNLAEIQRLQRIIVADTQRANHNPRKD